MTLFSKEPARRLPGSAAPCLARSRPRKGQAEYLMTFRTRPQYLAIERLGEIPGANHGAANGEHRA